MSSHPPTCVKSERKTLPKQVTLPQVPSSRTSRNQFSVSGFSLLERESRSLSQYTIIKATHFAQGFIRVAEGRAPFRLPFLFFVSPPRIVSRRRGVTFFRRRQAGTRSMPDPRVASPASKAARWKYGGWARCGCALSNHAASWATGNARGVKGETATGKGFRPAASGPRC